MVIKTVVDSNNTSSVVSYRDVVVDCDVEVMGAELVVSGKVPKPPIFHEGSYHEQTQTIRLKISVSELVSAIKESL
ncbi:hypothetical protein VPHK391_0004 [Vibrio phage K391]